MLLFQNNISLSSCDEPLLRRYLRASLHFRLLFFSQTPSPLATFAEIHVAPFCLTPSFLAPCNSSLPPVSFHDFHLHFARHACSLSLVHNPDKERALSTSYPFARESRAVLPPNEGCFPQRPRKQDFRDAVAANERGGI